MADIIVIEDIFANWKERGIGTAFEVRSPAMKLALHTKHAELGIATVIIEIESPEISIDRTENGEPEVGYVTVPLESLAAAVRKLDDQYANLAPKKSR